MQTNAAWRVRCQFLTRELLRARRVIGLWRAEAGGRGSRHTDNTAAALGEIWGGEGADGELGFMAVAGQRLAGCRGGGGGERRRGYGAGSKARQPMDGNVPPLTCLSYNASSALGPAGQPLVGGAMTTRGFRARCARRTAWTGWTTASRRQPSAIRRPPSTADRRPAAIRHCLRNLPIGGQPRPNAAGESRANARPWEPNCSGIPAGCMFGCRSARRTASLPPAGRCKQHSGRPWTRVTGWPADLFSKIASWFNERGTALSIIWPARRSTRGSLDGFTASFGRPRAARLLARLQPSVPDASAQRSALQSRCLGARLPQGFRGSSFAAARPWC